MNFKTFDPIARVSVFPLPLPSTSLEIVHVWNERFLRHPGHQWLRRAFAELSREES